MKALSTENFKENIDRDTLTLVDFWAEWCGPCRMMLPIMEDLSNEVDTDKIEICKCNVDEAFKVAGEYGIRSIPTFILFKNGEVLETFSGSKSKNDILGIVSKHI